MAFTVPVRGVLWFFVSVSVLVILFDWLWFVVGIQPRLKEKKKRFAPKLMKTMMGEEI
jgi:hypothetical protein